MASGHDENSRGVAIILHSRWARSIKQFCGVNERLAYLDLNVNKIRLRLISAYFPHSGYADEEIQRMYTALSTIKLEAKQNKRRVMIAGDFNARVG